MHEIVYISASYYIYNYIVNYKYMLGLEMSLTTLQANSLPSVISRDLIMC